MDAAAALAAAAVMVCATPLSAQARARQSVPVPQPLLALAHHNLTFGTVLPGVPTTVPSRDARAALFEIQGPTGASIRIELLLPTELISEGDLPAQLPVRFGPESGFADYRLESVDRPGFGFNPNQPLITQLSAQGRLFLRLGGTALPGRPQRGGAYSATIVLTIYDLGS